MKRLLFILALVCAPTYAQTNTARMLSGTNVVTVCPYTIQATDTTKLLVINSASACAVSLPAATTANFGAGAIFSVKNQGAGTATITPASGTINGSATLILTTGQGADIYSDGVNYQSQQGAGTGGGGGSPGGTTGDTQCKSSGGAFIACSRNPEIRYVSSTGNDANSGLTWDTAKATVFAALESLPSGTTSPPQVGTGTVIVGDNTYWNPDHTKGLWILAPSDPNYSAPPSGWIRGVSPTFWPVNIIGQGCGTQPGSNVNDAQCAIQMIDTPGIGLGGTNNPAIWLAGGQIVNIQNLNLTGHYGRCMALGIDSTGNRSAIGASNMSFQNMTCQGGDGVDNGGKGRGPSIDLGALVFNITFDKVTTNVNLSVNEALIATAPTGLSVTGGVLTVTFTAANTAFFNGEGCGIIGANAPQYNFSVQGTPGGSGITVVDSTHITMATSLPNGTSGGGVLICDRGIPIVSDGGTSAAGQFTYRDAVMNGGGIRAWGGNVIMRDVYTEGDFTHCNAPAIWFVASGGGLGQSVLAENVTEADLCPSVNNAAQSNPVKIEGSISPENIQITSDSQSPYTEGSLTYRGDSNNGVKNNPLTKPEWGIVRGHLEAQTDVHRHSPQSVRFVNYANQTAAGWTTTGLTITTGQTDNDGGTNAVKAVPPSGTASVLFMSGSSTPGTWNIGDIGICGAWMQSLGTPDAYQGNTALNISCNTAGGSISGPTCNFPVVHGDGEWDWYWCEFTVLASASFTNFSTGTLTTSTPVNIYAPTLIHIPSGQASTNEAIQLAYDMRSLPPACTAGQTCDHVGPLLHASGGVANAVTDWATSTTLGSISGTVTGQALTAQNGSAPSFASAGIQDGNSGSAVTTTPYTIQCDSSTTLIDRTHILRLQSGASVVTVPLSTATGCAGGFVTTLVNDGAGNVTVNSSSPDTFSIFDGGANTDSATSFILSTGQHATLNQGASGLWEVRKTLAGVGSGASPTMGFYIGPNCPKSNTGNCFYTPADTQVANDCSWTNSTGVITCSNSHFTAADVGKSVMGGRSCSGDTNATIGAAGYITAGGSTAMPTITTFTSSTSVTISATPANAQALVSTAPIGGCFIWGHIDDTGFSNLSTAVAATTQCPKVFLSAGYYLITFPPAMMTTNPSSCINIGGALGGVLGNPGFGSVTLPMGFEVEGRGSGNTALYLAPNFPNGDTCAHLPTPSASALNTGGCFVIPVMGGWMNFRIDGGYQGVNANLSGKTLVYAAVAKIYDWSCVNFAGYTGGGSIGLELSYLNQLHVVNNSGCGSAGITTDLSATGNVGDRVIVESSGFNALNINSGSSFGCYYCTFVASNTSGLSPNAVVHSNGGTIHMFGGGMGVCNGNLGACTTTGLYVYRGDNSANLYADGVNFSSNSGGSTTNGGIECTTACNNYVNNSLITSQSGAFDYLDVSGSLFVDLGGNTWTPRTSISGSFIGESDSANNIAVTAPKLVLSANWGTGAAVSALTGGDAPIKFTITNGSASTGASPTITYTFPFPYAVAPFSCTATQVGGTNTTGTFTGSSLSVTGVTFTFSLTPTASNTEIVQVTCVTP